MYRRPTLAVLALGALLAGALTPVAAAEPADIETTAARGWQLVGPNAKGGDLAFTAAAPERLYVLPPVGRNVYRTDDRARSWRTPTFLNQDNATGSSLAADPWDPDLVYVTTTPHNEGRGGVLRSTDGARSFRQVLDVPGGLRGLAVSRSGREVFAGGPEGVYTSRDRGGHWKLLAGSPKNVRHLGLAGDDLVIGAQDGIHVMAGGTGKPRKTSDLSPDTFAVQDRIAVAAGVFGPALVSTDRGRSWRELTGPWNPDDATPFVGLSPAGEVHLQTVAGSQTGEGERGTWISRDAGRSWRGTEAMTKIDLYTEVGAFPDRPDTLVVSGAAGVFTTRDSVEFQRIGVPETDVSALTVSGNALLAGTSSGSYRATTPLSHWQPPRYQDWGWTGQMPHTLGNRIGALETVPGKASEVLRVRNTFCPGDCFVLERSADGGRNWTRGPSFNGNSRSVIVDPRDSQLVYTGSYLAPGVHYSGDGGTTFTEAHTDVLEGVTGLAADPTRKGGLWIADVSGLHRASGSSEVTKVFDGRVDKVEVDPADPRHVVAVGDGFVKVSRDGTNFTDAKAPAQYYTQVAFGPRGTLFVGTRDWSVPGQGVLRSTDGGRSFTALGKQPVDREIGSLLVSPDGRWLFAGTYGSGVHRLPLR